jgi:membrane-associated protease RseP (regulator of RpoE activity)
VTVRRNSPAAQAQLQVGDVIVAVNNQQITNSVELFAALAGHNPGDVVTFTVDRRIRRVIPRRNATPTPEDTQQPQIAPGVIELDIQITLVALPTPQPRPGRGGTGRATSTPVATSAR